MGQMVVGIRRGWFWTFCSEGERTMNRIPQVGNPCETQETVSTVLELSCFTYADKGGGTIPPPVSCTWLRWWLCPCSWSVHGIRCRPTFIDPSEEKNPPLGPINPRLERMCRCRPNIPPVRFRWRPMSSCCIPEPTCCRILIMTTRKTWRLPFSCRFPTVGPRILPSSFVMCR